MPESNDYTLSAITWTMCLCGKYQYWKEKNTEAVHKNMEQVIEIGKDVQSIESLYKEKLFQRNKLEQKLMETMQTLVGVRVEQPHIWKHIDKKNVK